MTQTIQNNNFTANVLQKYSVRTSKSRTDETSKYQKHAIYNLLENAHAADQMQIHKRKQRGFIFSIL
jgi:hypothetical protein